MFQLSARLLILTLNDLKLAHEYLNQTLDKMSFQAAKNLDVEIYRILRMFHFRSAQMCAKLNLVSTCKLSLNMALVYSEFAAVTSRENHFEDQLRQAETFHESLAHISKEYFDLPDDVQALRT